MLLRRVQEGDRKAWDRLIASNLALVAMTARPLRHSELPFADLVQEGILGLIQAARRYDESKGTRFSTYAVWWIRKAILAGLGRAGLVRVPSYHKARLARIREAESVLRASLGRDPDRGEVSTRLSTTLADVERVLRNEPRRLSLDECVDREGGHPLLEKLPDDRCSSPESDMIRGDLERTLWDAFGRLRRSERFVLIQRYGLAGQEPLTLREVAARMGVSRERVRQIEHQACGRLRRSFTRRPRARVPCRGPERGSRSVEVDDPLR